MPVSKPFAIATEGPTVDGRIISRDVIQQMAASYDPKVYTAVINLEHYISALPDSVFSAKGKVLSLGTQEVEILGDKKLQLTAVVDVPDEVVAMQKSGKKAFSSMEAQPNFINKGIHYLRGLAFTDSPASIGTEPMKFSTFSSDKENVFAFASECTLEFEAEEQEPGMGLKLYNTVMGLLGKGKKDTDTRFADVDKAVEAVATSQRETLDTLGKVQSDYSAMQASAKESGEALQKLTAEFAELKKKLDFTDASSSHRRPAAGGDGLIKTDC